LITAVASVDHGANIAETHRRQGSAEGSDGPLAPVASRPNQANRNRHVVCSGGRDDLAFGGDRYLCCTYSNEAYRTADE